jgi:hypothetical protein
MEDLPRIDPRCGESRAHLAANFGTAKAVPFQNAGSHELFRKL